MADLKNSFNNICSSRRWLKKIFMPLLSNSAVLYLPNFDLHIHYNPKDLRGPSFHLAYDQEVGFLNYEEHDREEILNSLPKDSIFIDIGANIGLFSLYVAKQRPDVEILSFEPDTITRNCLNNSVTDNQFTNISIFSEAIGNHEGTHKLYKEISNDGGHTLVPNDSTSNLYEEIEVKRLRSILTEEQIQNIGCVKIDVEGAELEVVKGSLDILSEFTPFILIEVLNKNIGTDLCPLKYLTHHSTKPFVFRTPGSKMLYTYTEIEDIARKSNSPHSNYIVEFIKD